MFTGKKLIKCFYNYFSLSTVFYKLSSSFSWESKQNNKSKVSCWQLTMHCFEKINCFVRVLSSLWVRLSLSTWVGWPFCVLCSWLYTDFGQSLPSVLPRWTITTMLLTTPFPLFRLSPWILQNPTSSCLVRRWWTRENPALPRILMRPCSSSRPRSELHLLKMTIPTSSPVSEMCFLKSNWSVDIMKKCFILT